MPLTTDQVRQLASQGPLSTSQVQTLATPPVSTTPTTPTNPTITAALMEPKTAFQPVATEQTQVPVVSPYTLTADETQAETQETDLSKLIAGLTAETSAPFQEDARLKAEEAQGISAKKSALAGLQNTQKSLLAESQGIQLQLQQDIQNQQNLAQQGGANVTKGGLAPQTRALQTVANQSLLSNAIKQYGNNASLAAAQGDLASAMDYVDRAIQAEFLPKEKALAVAQANLTNLQKSGTLTRAQQKRADERQALIDAQKAALAEEKAIKTDTRDAVVKAISNNTGLPGFDNLDIAALQAAQTPEEVAAILQARGLSVASQADQLDMEYKQAQIDKMNEETAKIGRTSPITTTSTGQAVVTTQDGKEIPISPEAMNWVNLINNGSISLDEAMTKIGSTAASMKLKNEIIAGINAQGGQTETKLAAMNNTVSSINDILNGDIEYFGASIAPRSVFGFKVNPYYNSFKAKVDNLVASLAIDNLGLLKGPMSDKDIEFIKQMSSGLEIGMDEKSAKERLEKIKTRLEEKIKTASGTSDSQMAEQLTQTATKEQEALRTKYDY